MCETICYRKTKMWREKNSTDPPMHAFSCIMYNIANTENCRKFKKCKSKIKLVSQDHVFRIDPSKVEDGKGKSPYDPRHNAASVLVGKL